MLWKFDTDTACCLDTSISTMVLLYTGLTVVDSRARRTRELAAELTGDRDGSSANNSQPTTRCILRAVFASHVNCSARGSRWLSYRHGRRPLAQRTFAWLDWRPDHLLVLPFTLALCAGGRRRFIAGAAEELADGLERGAVGGIALSRRASLPRRIQRAVADCGQQRQHTLSLVDII